MKQMNLRRQSSTAPRQMPRSGSRVCGPGGVCAVGLRPVHANREPRSASAIRHWRCLAQVSDFDRAILRAAYPLQSDAGMNTELWVLGHRGRGGETPFAAVECGERPAVARCGALLFGLTVASPGILLRHAARNTTCPGDACRAQLLLEGFDLLWRSRRRRQEWIVLRHS